MLPRNMSPEVILSSRDRSLQVTTSCHCFTADQKTASLTRPRLPKSLGTSIKRRVTAGAQEPFARCMHLPCIDAADISCDTDADRGMPTRGQPARSTPR